MLAGDDDETNEKILSWMRFVCRLIYWCGLGDCWYEKTIRSATHNIAYAMYSFFSMTFIFLMVCSETASLSKTNMPDADKNDALTFSTAHIVIIMKWIFIVLHKEKIKKLLKKLLITTRELFTEKTCDIAQLRKSKLYCYGLAASMYSALFSTMIFGFVDYYKTGIPWRNIVMLYPDHEDDSWTAYTLKTIATYYWVHIITGMLAADFLVVSCLILIAFKFKTLQLYFISLETTLRVNTFKKSQIELENDMHQNFIKGIDLHREILWCATSAQKFLGNIYSFQTLQTMLIFIISLVKMVTNDVHNITYLLATLCIITCLLVLTGVYMWTAGEITYEASLVSEAMFQSGWHLCSARARMRKLLVVGISRSQVPVVMTAFGVVDLSYENFVKILKNSYSIFAVFY